MLFIYLRYFASTTYRYLISMEDHFSRYDWVKITKNKATNTIQRTLEQFLCIVNVRRYCSLTMVNNLLMILLSIIYKAKKIKFIHGRPYLPQSQGSIEEFNKYIQNSHISINDDQKEEFDLDEAVSNFCNIITQKKHNTKNILL